MRAIVRSAMIGLMVVMGCVIWLRLSSVFVRETPSQPEAKRNCASNVKSLALAVMMYAMDWDERQPLARDWCDALEPYTKNSNLLRCPSAPALEFAYGLNRAAAGAETDQIKKPAEFIMLFETNAGTKSFVGGPSDVAMPGRHEGENQFSFGDGHVKALAPERLPAKAWKLAPGK